MDVETAKKHHVAYLTGWAQGTQPSITKDMAAWIGVAEFRPDFERGFADGKAAYQRALMTEFDRLTALVAS